jgi:murein DD-endopeptidase MepM/ murein hydrolase activator NlpD
VVASRTFEEAQVAKERILAQALLPHDAALRRRAVVAAGVVSIFTAVGAFGTARESAAPPPPREFVIEALTLSPQEVPVEADQVFHRETHFERGDTFSALLGRLAVDAADAARLLRQNGGDRPFRQLRPGTLVRAETNEDGGLLSLGYVVRGGDTLLGFERDGERFHAIETPAQVHRQVFLKSGEIQSSLFAAADAAGLPDSITTQFADIFSGDVDFHRDLRRGDRFAVAYEVLYHDGQPLRAGRILAAEFAGDKHTYRAVWFVGADGRGAYYTPTGANLRKAFLRSPLEFSRISSGFARRMHPILNEWRAHNGIDYSAPTGTRVRATADGTVELAGRQDGYGNFVVLRHRGGVTTLYAHLSGFAPGVRKGARVEQSDAIGYVGATGWATGPHLHYEFRVNGRHRNPLTIPMPAAEPVPLQHIAEFSAATAPLVRQLGLVAEVALAGLE